MILNTKHFGEIEIDENTIIEFKEGLPGFENIKKYAVILNPDKEIPFNWLQAVEDQNLAFVITNPFLFKDDYEFDISDKVIEELDIKKQEDVMIFSIAVVPDDIKNMTINLRGPIVINTKNKKGKQIILDNDEYSLKYFIFEEAIEKNIG